MRCHRSFAVSFLLVFVVLLSAPVSLAAQTLCESSLPFNIDAGIVEPIALALLQQSPTFKQQCLRIATTIVLRVQVRIIPTLKGSRGQTTIQRHDTGALRAHVQLAFGEDYVELLAHEFEHVLEQVEQVRLTEQLSTRQAWITPTGAFETRRATEVGERARQECALLAVEAIEARRGRPQARAIRSTECWTAASSAGASLASARRYASPGRDSARATSTPAGHETGSPASIEPAPVKNPAAR